MTASICQDSQEHDTKQLVDNRDGKTYWVAKLKDGNCWMTQNLDLDLRNITLNSTNTSTTSSWTPNLTSSKWMVTSSDNSARYYDDGVVICNSSGCSKASGTYDEHYLRGITTLGVQPPPIPAALLPQGIIATVSVLRDGNYHSVPTLANLTLI